MIAETLSKRVPVVSKLYRTVAIALTGAASMVGQAHAEPLNRGALEAVFEEPVTLSATGAPQRATDAPVNMTIISQSDIRASGAIDLPGVLERLANVDVMRTSAGQVDVSIRGYNTTLSPRLLVLLNGRQVYLDDYGKTLWNAIPVQLSEIRQIEVVVGPNTALFGFNAVAGVVNIITYDALQDDIDEVSVRAGSRGYAAGAGVWTTRLASNLGVRLAVGGVNMETLANDDAVAAAFNIESLNPEARTVALNAAYDITSGIRLDLEATWARNQRAARYLDQSFLDPYEANSIKIGISGDTGLGLMQGQIYSNAHTLIGLEVRTTVASLSLVTKPAPAHTLRLAGEYRHNAMQGGGGTLAYDVRALSGMWSWQASEALAVTSAARVDALELGREGGFPDPAFPFTNADYDQAFTEWSYNLGAVYRLSSQDALRLSAARGVGSPSLIEYGYARAFPGPGSLTFAAGDPSMSPTIVYNVELGWDHELPAIGGRIRAAVFWQRNEDMRLFLQRTEVLSVSPVFTLAVLPAEVGASEMHGLDLGIEGARGRWTWDAHYSWRSIDDDLITSPANVQANFSQTSPEHVATASLAWTGDRYELGGDLRYTSETVQYGRGAVLTGLFPVAAYVQLNARAAWNATDRVQFELSGRNLLENQTQSVGLTPVQRSVYLTLRAEF